MLGRHLVTQSHRSISPNESDINRIYEPYPTLDGTIQTSIFLKQFQVQNRDNQIQKYNQEKITIKITIKIMRVCYVQEVQNSQRWPH